MLGTAKALFNNGEFFRCYDLALDGVAMWPGEPKFSRLAVLSLANAGASDLALEKFAEFKLDQRMDLESRSLLGRLKKDEGFASSGAARLRLLGEARAIYERRVCSGDWGGQRRGVLPGGECGVAGAVDGRYGGCEATGTGGAGPGGADAAAGRARGPVLADGDGAGGTPAAGGLRDSGRACCRGAGGWQRQARAGGDDGPAVAPDYRDFGRDAGVSQALYGACGDALHRAYHRGAQQAGTVSGALEEEAVREKIAAVLQAEGIGVGYGSLAAGADILFAEALLARDGCLNVILPFAIEDFLVQSVASAGEHWVTRFHNCLDAAKTVRYATEDSFMEHESLFNYCSQLGMGLAVLAARHMQAPVVQVAVWDGEARSGAAGTAVDLKAWQDAKLPQRIIRCGTRAIPDDLSGFAPPADGPGGTREIRAMLFADVHGFSKLNDRQLPTFAAEIMGPLGDVTQAFRPEIAFLNTWGDGIFAVLADAGKAAAWALKLQEAMHAIDLAAVGLPDSLRLRIGGHVGPAYELMDPVLRRMNFYGAHVSRAARIEPITPEGCVYVTETFAAVLALKCGNEFACDYVGVTEMAKHYGRLQDVSAEAARWGWRAGGAGGYRTCAA